MTVTLQQLTHLLLQLSDDGVQKIWLELQTFKQQE